MRHVRRYRDGLVSRGQAYWENFRGADPLLQGVAVVALIILTFVTLPFVWPGGSEGSVCSDLSAPDITGNNQSVMAAQSDPTNLRLELATDSSYVNQGQPLALRVHFINASMAPLTLFLASNDASLRYSPQEIGLQISVQASDGRPLTEPRNLHPAVAAPPQYSFDQIHVVGPRERCTVRLVFTPDRLNTTGIINGQYRFTAVYVNQNKGALPPVAAHTPTAIFHDQGVWVGGVQSNTITITIGLPTQPPPGK